MGYPKDEDRHVFDWCVVVQALVRAEFPLDTEILDVGPGFGKYRMQLPEFPQMDAVEVWEPYIREESLREMYRMVYQADVFDFIVSSQWHSYDLVILGDVLEHIERTRAVQLVQFFTRTCGDVLAIVPYGYVQGPVHGNPYQVHQQDDLTPDIMTTEYSELVLVDQEYSALNPTGRGLYRMRK